MTTSNIADELRARLSVLQTTREAEGAAEHAATEAARNAVDADTLAAARKAESAAHEAGAALDDEIMVTNNALAAAEAAARAKSVEALAKRTAKLTASRASRLLDASERLAALASDDAALAAIDEAGLALAAEAVEAFDAPGRKLAADRELQALADGAPEGTIPDPRVFARLREQRMDAIDAEAEQVASAAYVVQPDALRQAAAAAGLRIERLVPEPLRTALAEGAEFLTPPPPVDGQLQGRRVTRLWGSGELVEANRRFLALKAALAMLGGPPAPTVGEALTSGVTAGTSVAGVAAPSI